MIRKLEKKDKQNWSKLYNGYADFYKVPMDKGILHTINTKYLELIWPKDNRCPVLGNLFEMGYKNGKSKNLSPSLDRIVPKKGYIPGNFVIVSDIVNRLKSDASLEDMEKILKFYTNKTNKINNI